MDNSYYNPNSNHQYVSRNIPPKPSASWNGFDIVSFICGLFALALFCTGVLSFVFGALGILFAVLSRQQGRKMQAFSVTGVVLSAIGMLLGLLALVAYIVPLMIQPALQASYERGYEDGVNEYYSDYYDGYYDDYYYDDYYDGYYDDYYYDDYYDGYFDDYYGGYDDGYPDDFGGYDDGYSDGFGGYDDGYPDDFGGYNDGGGYPGTDYNIDPFAPYNGFDSYWFEGLDSL